MLKFYLISQSRRAYYEILQFLSKNYAKGCYSIEKINDSCELIASFYVLPILIFDIRDKKTFHILKRVKMNNYFTIMLDSTFNPTIYYKYHFNYYLNSSLSYFDLRKCIAYYLNFIKYQNKFIFKITTGLFQISLKDMCFFERNYKKVYLYTNDNKYVLRESFKLLVYIFEKYGFIIPHHSYLVNPKKIERIHQNMLTIRGINIPISESKRKTIKNILIENIK